MTSISQILPIVAGRFDAFLTQAWGLRPGAVNEGADYVGNAGVVFGRNLAEVVVLGLGKEQLK